MEKKINFRLKDWEFRDKILRCPLPIVYDEKGNVIILKKEDLPGKL